jgi:SAM-dependent methyltransferase
MYSRLRHAAGRLRRGLTHGAGSPGAGRGAEAGPDTYDAVFAASAEYARPWAQSRYYFLWCVLVDRLRAAGARRVLEVGCGPGQFATMAFALGAVDEYLGLDFSPTGVAIARSSCPQGRFEVADARTTHLYSEFDADALVCTEVLVSTSRPTST